MIIIKFSQIDHTQISKIFRIAKQFTKWFMEFRTFDTVDLILSIVSVSLTREKLSAWRSLEISSRN